MYASLSVSVSLLLHHCCNGITIHFVVAVVPLCSRVFFFLCALRALRYVRAGGYGKWVVGVGGSVKNSLFKYRFVIGDGEVVWFKGVGRLVVSVELSLYIC